MKTLRMASLVLFLALCAQGCLRGDRASTHMCPSDETCSDLTPEGLEFTGSHVADGIAVAVGGTLSVRIDRAGLGSGVPPFDAVLSDPTLATIDESSNGVELTGVSAGSTTLRILEEGTPLLFDRVGVRVGEIASARVLPDPTLGLFLGDYTRDREWAFLAGTETSASLLLEDSTGRHLVDEGMRVTFAGPATPTGSDGLTIPDTATAGTTELEISAGGASHVAELVIVDVAAIDGVELVRLIDGNLIVGSATIVCGFAQSGDRSVAGAAVTFTTEGTSISATVDESLGLPGCVTVEAVLVGTGTIVGHVGEATGSLEIMVFPNDAATSPLTGPPLPPAPEPLRGERASS